MTENDTNNESRRKPTFAEFVFSLNTQALILLGAFPNPISGKYEKNIPYAQHTIDTIAMLKDKTKNNLDKDEEELIDNILYDLRMRFVSAVQEPEKGKTETSKETSPKSSQQDASEQAEKEASSDKSGGDTTSEQ